MARLLYHFPSSVFSRRTRLALAHKKIDVELRDARSDAAVYEEAKKLSPQGTMPVFVDDGHVLGDSTTIAQYLDLAYEDRPRLFPRGAAAAEALAITSLVDVALNTVADLGTRYYELRNDPAWAEVVGERMRRAQSAIDEVARRTSILDGPEWGTPQLWTFAATMWLKTLPARTTEKFPSQIVTLGLRLPDALVRWAEPHASRPEIRAIYG